MYEGLFSDSTDESLSEDTFNSESDTLATVINWRDHGLDTAKFENNLREMLENDCEQAQDVEVMKVSRNLITAFPKQLHSFRSLRKLNLFNNRLTFIPDIFKHLPLETLGLAKNCLTDESFPKEFTASRWLKELILTNNQLTVFPEQVLVFKNLRYLHLGMNQIKVIPDNIWKLTNLKLLHIYENLIESIPESIAKLKHLTALRVHGNKIKTLPTNIVTMKRLLILSIRENPLVNRFISDMTYEPASLLELSARVIKLNNIPVGEGDVPDRLIEYLGMAHRCVNPNCKGVFFDSRVEHVKFVDFCGKYRLPLLQYLCSPKCVGGDNELHEAYLQRHQAETLKKVLLG